MTSAQAVPNAPNVPTGPAVPGLALRRGLPRVVGGAPWPPVGNGAAPVAVPTAVPVAEPVAVPVAAAETEQTAVSAAPREPDAPAEAAQPAAPAPMQAAAPAPSQQPATPLATVSAPAVTVSAPAAPASAPAAPASQSSSQSATAAAERPRSTPARLALKLVAWAVGAIAAAGIIVLAARGLTTLPGVPEFVRQYPGEYHPAVEVEPGFPAWARWTHFLNFFFLVLIVRTGLLVRHQRKPSAFFTPKRGGKKISIYLWLHTSIDLLWLLNGVVFVALLFASGHWARIVPTSWEVFPNAVSAMLQYVTLDWPTENGWVNYNSLQQLMYFVVVFVAAPLAAITGVRMSEWWPKDAARLNKLYPAPVARAIHYPVMLFFTLFVVVHVFLVFATGALRNLNHMFAGTDVVNWVGFWWFAAGILVCAASVWAARPLVIAPIAGLFGRVSER